MAITKLRGNSQMKQDTITGDVIRDHSITSLDIADGTLNGELFIDGSIPSSKIDCTELAGEGLAYNESTKKLDINVNIDEFQIVLDTLNATTLLTKQGNAFNGASQLVKLDISGKLPALDGSLLTSLPPLVGNIAVDNSTSPTGYVLMITGAGTAAWRSTIGEVVFADSVVPSGSIDGDNDTFLLPNTPSSGSLSLYLNGILQRGGGHDYVLDGRTITMEDPPNNGGVLLASYRL